MKTMSLAKRCAPGQRGLSTVELLIVIAIMLSVAAWAVPNILQAIYDVKLRSAAGDFAGLMQQARILAAKNGATYTIRTTTLNGERIAYIDDGPPGSSNAPNNGTYDAQEPLIPFTGSVQYASAAPTGSGGQPAAYTYPGDTGSGTPYDNATTLAFNTRGLPCAFSSGACGSTPAPNYFVYYLNDTRPLGGQGWAAVLVTKAGRTRVFTFNGGIWH